MKYRIVSCKNPQTNEVKYRATIALTSALTLDVISQRIEKKSTVSSADIKAVLDALQYEIMDALSQGSSVRLGDVGSFCPVLNSRTVDTEESFKASNIERVRVRFTPSAMLRHYLDVDRVSFERDASSAHGPAGGTEQP